MRIGFSSNPGFRVQGAGTLSAIVLKEEYVTKHSTAPSEIHSVAQQYTELLEAAAEAKVAETHFGGANALEPCFSLPRNRRMMPVVIPTPALFIFDVGDGGRRVARERQLSHFLLGEIGGLLLTYHIWCDPDSKKL